MERQGDAAGAGGGRWKTCGRTTICSRPEYDDGYEHLGGLRGADRRRQGPHRPARPATGATPSPPAPGSPRGRAASPSGRSAATAASSPSIHAAQRAGTRRHGHRSRPSAARPRWSPSTARAASRCPPGLREPVGIGDHGAPIAIEGQGDRLEITGPRPAERPQRRRARRRARRLRPLTRNDTNHDRSRRRTDSSTGLARGRCGRFAHPLPPDGRWKAPTPPADHQLDRGDIPTCARRPGGSRWANRPSA